MPCDDQRVIFNGKQLEDCDILSLCGVEDEATLAILGRLLGGAKKRKKKTYTKPKKQKHKHKKIKLRVLKFYKAGAWARGRDAVLLDRGASSSVHSFSRLLSIFLRTCYCEGTWLGFPCTWGSGR